MMHVGLGRTHPLHIEYIHIGACLSFIQDIMTEAILSHPRLHLTNKIALVKALGKIIWIQNDLFAKWHIHDGVEEFAVDHEEIFIEKEGYLHGKKILGESEDEEEDDEDDEGERTRTFTATSSCPFSGMAGGGSRAVPVVEKGKVEAGQS
jgi:Protoglobin